MKSKIKSPLTILWLLLAGLLLANGWVLLHRHEGFAYKHFVTYDELYVANEMLYIEKLELLDNKGSFTLNLETPAAWGLTLDDTMPASVVLRNKQLVFDLPEGIHHFRFSNVLLQKNFYFDAIIDNACGNKAGENCLNELRFLTLPMPAVKMHAVSFWSGQQTFSALDLMAGKQLLQPENAAKSVEERLRNVANLTSAMKVAMHASELQPAMLETMRPDSLIKYVIAQQTGLNCGNFSFFIHYLCSSLGIANRSVQFADDGDNWSHGIHYFNEIFVPEKNGWAMVDALHNLWMPQDSTGRLVNATDLVKLLQSGSSLQEFVGYRFQNDSMVALPLSLWKPQLQLYFANAYSMLSFWPANSHYKMDAWSRVKRFYGFDTSKYVNSDRYSNNWLKIMVKLMLAFSFLLTAFLLIIIYWQKESRKKREPFATGTK